MFCFNLRKWLRRISGQFFQHPFRYAPQKANQSLRTSLLVELLEDRVVPAMVKWTAGSADWSVPANWTDQSDSSHRVPGSGDDAVIDTAVTVTHSTNSSDTVK